MAKTYKNIAGTWTPIKFIWKNIAGTWTKLKKGYKNVRGTWQVVYAGEVNYTFATSITASTSTGILLSSYVNPASADVFNITVNSGVVLSGMTGAHGANGANGICNYTVANCRGSWVGYGHNGGAGGAGGAWAYNTSGVVISTAINAPTNGTNGAGGATNGAFTPDCGMCY